MYIFPLDCKAFEDLELLVSHLRRITLSLNFSPGEAGFSFPLIPEFEGELVTLLLIAPSNLFLLHIWKIPI